MGSGQRAEEEGEEWPCGMCALLNTFDLLHCDGCGTRRGSSLVAPPAQVLLSREEDGGMISDDDDESPVVPAKCPRPVQPDAIEISSGADTHD